MSNAECKLIIMFCLNFTYFLVELIVGYLTHSMSLVADSFHMLSDVAALVVAYIAVRMSSKKWSKNTYGWARAEVLGALVNSVFLLALCFSIIIESIKRFINPEELENPVLILIVGSIGLFMNLVGLCMFREEGHGHSHSHGHSHAHAHTVNRSTLTHSNRLTRMVKARASEQDLSIDDSVTSEPDPDILKVSVGTDAQTHTTVISISRECDEPHLDKGKKKSAKQMNIQGVFLHLMADALGSVIVLVSALVVWLTDWEGNKYIDPALSLIVVCLIMISVYPLLVESSMILLQSVPAHIDVDEIENKLLRQVDGIIGVHELHVWQLAGDRIIATAHIRCRTIQEYSDIAEKVKALLHHEGIHSTTIQPEFSKEGSTIPNDPECMLSCVALSSTCTGCSGNTCCPPKDAGSPSKSKTRASP